MSNGVNSENLSNKYRNQTTETKTPNYQSKKQGKLIRKKTNKDTIKKIKSDADKNIAKIEEKLKYLKNIDTKYSDKDIIKKIKADKKAKLTQIKDKERGARRTDRQNWKIQKIANRNNVSLEQAEKMYDQRRIALNEFKKGPRQAAPYSITNENREQVDAANKKRALEESTQGNPYAAIPSQEWTYIGDSGDGGATTTYQETSGKNPDKYGFNIPGYN